MHQNQSKPHLQEIIVFQKANLQVNILDYHIKEAPNYDLWEMS